MNYQDFLAAKHIRTEQVGFEVPLSDINQRLFPWQRQIVRWSLRTGRAALFEQCGLGKTIQQLEWARHVASHTGKPVILLCPLAVAEQTIREAKKFAIDSPIRFCESGSDVGDGINVTNYEKLHKFDATVFGGVVLDESGILKSFVGKTKRQLIAAFQQTRFKLACTATPAPNDLLELGNHADFLGVMPSNEMIARWFVNDSMHVGQYRLKAYGAKDFWQWVASWAVCLNKPSDIGHSDEGYDLPTRGVSLDEPSLPKSLRTA